MSFKTGDRVKVTMQPPKDQFIQQTTAQGLVVFGPSQEYVIYNQCNGKMGTVLAITDTHIKVEMDNEPNEQRPVRINFLPKELELCPHKFSVRVNFNYETLQYSDAFSDFLGKFDRLLLKEQLPGARLGVDQYDRIVDRDRRIQYQALKISTFAYQEVRAVFSDTERIKELLQAAGFNAKTATCSYNEKSDSLDITLR